MRAHSILNVATLVVLILVLFVAPATSRVPFLTPNAQAPQAGAQTQLVEKVVTIPELQAVTLQLDAEKNLEEALTKARVNGKYRTLLRQIEMPQDAAQYGPIHDHGFFMGTEWKGVENPPYGHWVYVQPYWYIWRDLAAAPVLNRNWGPEQVVGAPNTAAAGDRPTAWASQTTDGQSEWLQLEFEEPLTPTGLKIYETYNPGAVRRVTVFTLDGKEMDIWQGDAPTRGVQGIGVLSLQFKAGFKTNRVKLYLDSIAVPGWNEIDAVGLVDAAGQPHWATNAVASSTYAEQNRPQGETLLRVKPVTVPPLREGLPEGSFEPVNAQGNGQGQGNASGWMIDDPDRIKVVEEEGNHFLRFTNRKKEFMAAPNNFKLDPTWKRIRVQTKIRALGLRFGENAWENARLQYWFEDTNGNKVGPWQRALELKHDADDWIIMRSDATVPPNATVLRVSPEMLNTSGQVDFDDIKVTPAPSWPELPLRAGFPEGTFETIDAQGNPAGWILDDFEQAKQIKIEVERGNHFLRLTNPTTADSVSVSTAFKLNPLWKKLKIRVRLRGKNIKGGRTPESRPRLAYLFADADGTTGPWISNVPKLEQDSDWTIHEVEAQVPKGATLLVLIPEMVNSSGITDFDDIQILPLD